MSRHPLVEHRGGLLPGVEGVHPQRHRPPHPARPGQILRRAGVVDAAGVGRCDAALQLTQWFGDVEVRVGQRFHRTVGQLLHPPCQRLGAVDQVAALAVEAPQGLGRGGAGIQPIGDGVLLCDDAAQQLQSPLVGLVEVDRGAEEAAGQHPVGLASAAVGVAGVRPDVLAQHARQSRVRVRGLLGMAVQLVAQRVGARCCLGDHPDEQLLDLPRLFDAAPDLAGGRRPARGHRGAQAVGVSRRTLGNLGQPAADRRPVLFGVGGHQVEHIAHRLQWGGDDVQLAQIQAGLVQIEQHTEAFAHRGDGDGVGGVRRSGRVQLTQRRTRGLRAGDDPVRGVVGDLVVVTGDARFGCPAGIQGGRGLEVTVGDSVDRRGRPTQGCWWRRCHTWPDRRSGSRW